MWNDPETEEKKVGYIPSRAQAHPKSVHAPYLCAIRAGHRTQAKHHISRVSTQNPVAAALLQSRTTP